jgi:hypothetical protein
MGWLLMMLYSTHVFTVFVDSHELCQELGRLNIEYWLSTGQIAQAICMKTFEV